MSWRLAKSLEVLRDQFNSTYPNRSKASDGTIGDTSHAASASDHNPNPQGVVCAMDITHDPSHGVDTYRIADNLITNRHPDLKYIISNSRIAGAWTNWNWTPYYGSNPHNHHMHVSVGVGNDGQSRQPYDDTNKWNIIGDEMITKELLEILFGAFFGSVPTQADYNNWVGKNELSNLVVQLERDVRRKAYFDTVQKGFACLNGSGSQYEKVTFEVFKKKG